MKIFGIGDVDVGRVGPTIRRLECFDSFFFSFKSGEAAAVAWVTCFLDGVISIVSGCLERGYWVGETMSMDSGSLNESTKCCG